MRQKGFVLLPVIVIVILVGVVGYLIYQNTQIQRGNISKTSQTPSSLNKEMLSRGIHPGLVDIKVLENTTAQWQDKSIAYTLEKVYLTPDIADMGNYRNNDNVKDKYFLIAQLGVRDRRTNGDRRQIPAGDYLRLRQSPQDLAPIDSDYLYLSPQENGTVYVIFPVDKNLSQFNLLIGILKSPKVLYLDFNSKVASTLNGVFLLKQGFASEYKE